MVRAVVDRIERAASLVVVALRHLALQLEELAALGHLHKDTPHAELAKLVRDRFIRHALILTVRRADSSYVSTEVVLSMQSDTFRSGDAGTRGTRCPE